MTACFYKHFIVKVKIEYNKIFRQVRIMIFESSYFNRLCPHLMNTEVPSNVKNVSNM
uniref:Uncharacterized protein n=1 Tax=Anguilla anguilla TaxID=7936 RepID=A0A0E9XZJ0_ANGAN